MIEKEFIAQIERLKAVFGANRFPNEFMQLIWKQVGDLPTHWMENCTNAIIGEMRAPKLSDFVDDAKDFRDRERQVPSSSAGMIGILESAARRGNSDFGKMCVKLIKDKLDGKYNPAQWEQAMQYLGETAQKLNPGCCELCNGHGYLPDGDGLLKRCKCPLGNQRPASASGPRRSDGSREEVYISQWQKKPERREWVK